MPTHETVSPETTTEEKAAPITMGAPAAGLMLLRSQVGNRAFGRYLARESNDDVYAQIEEEADSEKLADDLAAVDMGETPEDLGKRFRHEIVKIMKLFADEPAVEGTARFDTFLTPEIVATSRALKNWTSCIDTLVKIFNDAARIINAEAGVKAETVKTKYGAVWKDGWNGVAKFTARSDAEQIARPLGAWVDCPEDPASTVRPKPGDILILHHEKNKGEFSHIGFCMGTGRTPSGAEYFVTIDGGQGAKGEWDEKGVYKAGTGRQEIKRRIRSFDPATRLIAGEPGQAGPMKKVAGWVDVEKLVVLPENRKK